MIILRPLYKCQTCVSGLSENSIERFKDGEDRRGNIKEKHSTLKKTYHEVKKSFENLEQRMDQSISFGTDPGAGPDIGDPRVRELWSLALRSNLSKSELASFKVIILFYLVAR